MYSTTSPGPLLSDREQREAAWTEQHSILDSPVFCPDTHASAFDPGSVGTVAEQEIESPMSDGEQKGDDDVESAFPTSGIEDGMHYRKVTDESRRQRAVCCAKPWVLLAGNPGLDALRGASVYLLGEQLHHLWAGDEQETYSMLIGVSATSSLVGFTIGALSLSVSQTNRLFGCLGLHGGRSATNLERVRRIWTALMEGFGAISPAILGQVIEGYCSSSERWDKGECDVSDSVFRQQFIPAPVIIGGLYVIWNCVPPSTKEVWAKQGACKKLLLNGIEAVCRTLLYSRFCEVLIREIDNLSGKPDVITRIKARDALYFEIPAMFAAALAVAFQAFISQPHREKIATLMNYLYATVVGLKLGVDLDERATLPVAIAGGIIFPMTFLLGTFLTAWWSRKVVEERIVTERLIPVGNPSWLRAQMYTEIEDEIRARIIAETNASWQEVLGPEGAMDSPYFSREFHEREHAGRERREDQWKEFLRQGSPMTFSYNLHQQQRERNEPLLGSAEHRTCPCPRLACTIL